MDLNQFVNQVRVPTNSSKIWKDECAYSFNTAEKGDGLFVDLNSFIAVSRPWLNLNLSKTQHNLYLNIKKVVVPSERSTNPNPSPPKKLAIGVEGGFNDEDQVKYEDKYSLYVHPNNQYFDLTDPSIPPKILESMNEVIRINSQSRKEEIVGWSADQVLPSKHADNLKQLDNGIKIGPKDWKCSHQGCDKLENLWLNLSDGYIGCGRQYSDGTGGNGHALKHYDETKYPLSVKLGTISKDGADVYSYPEDDMVSDPHLAQHLEHFGINILNMQKTEKSMAELELDQNLNFEFGKILEKGKELENAFGPGMTGIENLGNTCYMSSVLQTVFATPHFLNRYLNQRQHTFKEITQDPSQSFEIQMSKLADGIQSGDYSVPEASNVAKSEEEYSKASQIGIAPKMFKSLVSGKHPLFSTFQQQDALEYFQYLLESIDKHEKTRPSWIKEDNPTKAFTFIQEDRIQCGTSGKVKYSRKMDNILSLNITLEATTNKEAVHLYEQQVELNGGKKDPNVEEVRPIIPLQACINNFIESYKVDDFYSSAINSKTFSINSSRMETFPDYVYIDAPETLDLELLRGNGKKPEEELLPEDGDVVMGSSEPKFNQELIAQLMEFGFPPVRCQKASIAVQHKMDVDGAMNWLVEHSEDAGIDDPIPEPTVAKKKGSEMTFKDDDISMLGAMGFTDKQAKLALKATANNVERAADWLFSHMDELDLLVAQAESENSSSSSSSSSAAAASTVDQLKNKVNDGAAKYHLVGFITHLGNNVQMGHYICHVKKNGKWVKFNDRSVQLSQQPAKEFGYMYFYSRNPTF
ncbi:deubiquitinating enzyme [Cavenderia fasciculata]|uniref:Ubiquitin carboxyl-terminal hydrolase n=1 Tax=Cavenderia fasciculata TaxID=261658 RepID=F4Q3D9_CACFS|nr:deubiquitinating enzyme [Cavenderia fasciculata]EGG16808.1 deubiquitinating enzyme [Cavenderia fasciculata]|eukprot:XP_004355282.1 deubiquitinating enzyme [Cavenderia fasciculata]